LPIQFLLTIFSLVNTAPLSSSQVKIQRIHIHLTILMSVLLAHHNFNNAHLKCHYFCLLLLLSYIYYSDATSVTEPDNILIFQYFWLPLWRGLPFSPLPPWWLPGSFKDDQPGWPSSCTSWKNDDGQATYTHCEDSTLQQVQHCRGMQMGRQMPFCTR